MSRPGHGHVAAVCIGLALGLAACGGSAQTGFVPMNAPPAPLRSRAASEVALIDSASSEAPGRDHIEVGLFEVLVDDWSAADQAAARAALRRRGADIGCDAVVLLGKIDWIYTVESSRSSRVRHGYRGVCIVYR